MAEWVRACVQPTLKIVNSVIGLVGMSMILYSLWMIRGWFRERSELSPGFSGSSTPWFIFSFLGLGIFLCAITCSGHIAAETINGHCLSCYTAFVFLLLLLEAAITTDIFLNRHWEADFPRDPTGRLDELKDFVQSNFELCKLISILVVVAQALSIFLSMVLRSLGSDHDYYYDSDDDSVPARLSLLRKDAPNTHHIANATLFFKNHPWIVRIHDKVCKLFPFHV
ncbi:tetraspanin-19 isoform X2 [Phalaenopsis equestris]|uniref:tetraspanin-19 isoform X2 n=1 Tax=Phalaenopsis equestris TaxID=78828 RepID=UPI0009E4DE80|nr:tetraspanin-19 isoform X2 [Phalaenopsis equestris]